VKKVKGGEVKGIFKETQLGPLLWEGVKTTKIFLNCHYIQISGYNWEEKRAGASEYDSGFKGNHSITRLLSRVYKRTGQEPRQISEN